MNARRRGACPGLTAPMPTGDGLLARFSVTPAVSLDAFAALCAAARAHGNGIVEVTARGNIQVRGLTAATAPAFAAAIEALAIADPTEGRVLASPLAGLDPSEVTDVSGLAAELRELLMRNELAARLAPKVSIVIDGGGAFGLDDVPADLRLRAVRDPDGVAFHVAVAGAAPLGIVTSEHTADAAIRVLQVIAAQGQTARARDLLPLLHLPLEGGGRPAEGRSGGGDLSASPAFAGRPHPVRLRSATAADPPPAGEGVNAYRLCDNRLALGVGLAFGHAQAQALEALIDEARRAGVTSIRPAPGRMLLAIGLAADHLAPFAAAAERLGFVVRADDPRRRVVACAGAPVCASAEIETRKLAATLAPRLDCVTLVHVSGCPKGCAHPGAAALTIVGIEGRCGLVQTGSARDAPQEIVAPPDVHAAIERLAAKSPEPAHG